MKHVPAVFKSASFILLSLALLAMALISALPAVLTGELWLSLSLCVIVVSLAAALIGYMFRKA